MPASNTRDCFRTFVGQKMTGLMFDALPLSRRDIASGCTHMIFEDGRALTISSNGTYWVESAEDVRAAIARKESELKQNAADIEEVLAAAGASNQERKS